MLMVNVRVPFDVFMIEAMLVHFLKLLIMFSCQWNESISIGLFSLSVNVASDESNYLG